MSYSYKYPRPAVTVDAVVFSEQEPRRVLLIQRKAEPFRDQWALPGGFFDMDDDSTESAVARELEEETGLTGVKLKLFNVFSDKGRDPRGRTLAIAFMGVVETERVTLRPADDAKDAGWFDVNDLPALAFDHDKAITDALNHL